MGFFQLLIVAAAFVLPIRAILALYLIYFIGTGIVFGHFAPKENHLGTAVPGIIMSLFFLCIAIFIIKYRRLNKLLNQSLEEIKTLRGILPICASCKNIRNDKGYWEQIEKYISTNTDAQFTHSICPDCLKKLYPDLYK